MLQPSVSVQLLCHDSTLTVPSVVGCGKECITGGTEASERKKTPPEAFGMLKQPAVGGWKRDQKRRRANEELAE